MACPTCGHTMNFLGGIDLRRYWCPRCGTLKEESGGLSNRRETHQAPALVDRCRLYWNHVACTDPEKWIAAGLAEATTPPEGQP